MVTQGARVGEGAVLGEGTILNPTIPVIDAETGDELSRGVVPAWSVAVSASRRREYPGGEFFLPCVLVIRRLTEGQRHDKAQLERGPARARRLGVSPADLLALTAELVAVPSVSHHESALADRVEPPPSARAPGWRWTGWATTWWPAPSLGRPQRVVLAGHLDTVPPAGNEVPRLDGEVLWGLGAADMKGGLAVMLDLAPPLEQPAVDVTWCFYACEEVDRDDSGLAQIWRDRPELLAGDAAVLGEPTGGPGRGRVPGHDAGGDPPGRGPGPHGATVRRASTPSTAWPRCSNGWTAGPAGPSCSTAASTSSSSRRWRSTAAWPATSFPTPPRSPSTTASPPTGTSRAARQFLRALFDGLSTRPTATGSRWWTRPPGRRPRSTTPSWRPWSRATGQPPRAKVGWTDVATFWDHGVPAANFGPGDPLLAHHPDERVERPSLDRVRAVLGALLTETT